MKNNLVMQPHTSTSAVLTTNHKNSVNRSFTTEMGNWINSMDWKYYVTFTTRYPLSMQAARRKMEKLNTTLNSKFGDSKMFWVAEPFDTKISYHTHALINLESVEKNITERAIISNWQSITGGSNGKGFNRSFIENYIKDKGAHFYLSKYLTQVNSDWDICV